jgi:serine/threonine protein kinase
MLYTLSTGYEPFCGDTDDELLISNKQGDIDTTTGTEWSMLSPDGQDFILSCLHYNPSMRLTPYQAFHHPWIQTVYGMDVLLNGEYPPKTLKQKKSMNLIHSVSDDQRNESSCLLS